MEYVPHNYLCHTLHLNSLSRGVIHRTVNRILGVENELQDHLDELQFLVCSEPFIWNPWIEEFGRNIVNDARFLPRLKKQMSYNNEIIACRAICTLNELVHHPELAVEAIKLRIIPRFVKTLKSKNVTIVQRSLLCLKHICMQPMGVVKIIENPHLVENIKKCIRHPESSVIRCQAARTVNALVHNYFAIHTLAENFYAEEIMKCVYETKNFNVEDPITYPSIIEMKDVMVHHLDSLVRLLDDGDNIKVSLISAGAFNLAPFLTGNCLRLKMSVVSLFAELAKHPIGKSAVVAHGLIPTLCEGIASGHNTDIKTKMAAVLQFATIHKEGLKQAYESNLITILTGLLPLGNVPGDLKRYALNILTNLAELPEGRRALRKLLSEIKIKILINHRYDESIQRSIKKLYQVINWEP